MFRVRQVVMMRRRNRYIRANTYYDEETDAFVYTPERWRIYYDYEDEYGDVHTVSGDFEGTYEEMREYVQWLNKNTDYFNFETVSLSEDW